jgi:hypothetical protein
MSRPTIHHTTLKPLANTDAARWDEFVHSAANGTMFHLRRFLGYHPPERFTDHSLMLYENGGKTLKAVFPAIDVVVDKDRVLYSHRGASYGGLVYQAMGMEDALRWVNALQHYAKEQGFSKILMTIPPLVYSQQPSNYLDFALMKSGFRYQKRELTAVLRLPTAAEGILPMFKQEARTATRKAMKQITVRLSDDYATYYQILSHNLMMRHGVTPTHSLAELTTLAGLFPERVQLWAAYLDNQMIAGVVNFVANDNVVLGFYISDNKDFQEYRALNYIFYRIFEWCIERRYAWYDFGTFTLNMEPNIGLGKFKETFGARGIFRDTLEVLL